MAEVLRVHAKPGVLATDHRALPARRFIGRDHAPPVDGPGLKHGALANGLHDPSKLHLGEPNDVDELFPIRHVKGGHEHTFDINHKHPHVAHKERQWYRHLMKQIAQGDVLPADEETAKKCGVKFEAPAEEPKAEDIPAEADVHVEHAEHVEEHAK